MQGIKHNACKATLPFDVTGNSNTKHFEKGNPAPCLGSWLLHCPRKVKLVLVVARHAGPLHKHAQGRRLKQKRRTNAKTISGPRLAQPASRLHLAVLEKKRHSAQRPPHATVTATDLTNGVLLMTTFNEVLTISGCRAVVHHELKHLVFLANSRKNHAVELALQRRARQPKASPA